MEKHQQIINDPKSWPNQTPTVNEAKRNIKHTVIFISIGWFFLILVFLNSDKDGTEMLLLAVFAVFCLYLTVVEIPKTIKTLSIARELDRDGIEVEGMYIGKWQEPFEESTSLDFSGYQFSYRNRRWKGKIIDSENAFQIGNYAIVRFLPRNPNISKILSNSNRILRNEHIDLDNKQNRDTVMTNGPIGKWRAVPSTFLVVMDDWFIFRSDGSGRFTSQSVMSGDYSQDFRWRMAEYGILQCQIVYSHPDLGSDGQLEEPIWFNLPMQIELYSTDTGAYWVLREQGRKGFWDSFTPLIPEH